MYGFVWLLPNPNNLQTFDQKLFGGKIISFPQRPSNVYLQFNETTLSEAGNPNFEQNQNSQDIAVGFCLIVRRQEGDWETF